LKVRLYSNLLQYGVDIVSKLVDFHFAWEL